VQSILSKKLSPGEKASDQDIAIAFSECGDKTASMAVENIKLKLAIANLFPTKPDSFFDKGELERGIKVELEHTNDESIAKEIAKHHLEEFSNYYIELPKFEKGLEPQKTASVALQILRIKLASLKIPLRIPNVRYLTASLDGDFIADPQKQGKFASYFLLKGDEINGREWGVSSQSIPENIASFIGRPLIATGEKFVKDSPYGVNYVHPSISHFIGRAPELVAGLDPMNIDHILKFQEQFRIGTIDDVFFNQDTQIWNASVKLAQGVESSDLPPFCSPALYQLDMTEPEGNITKWSGLHLAALDQRPAYGSMALLNGTCSGTSGSCKTQFAGTSNSLKSDVMRIAAQLPKKKKNY